MNIRTIRTTVIGLFFTCYLCYHIIIYIILLYCIRISKVSNVVYAGYAGHDITGHGGGNGARSTQKVRALPCELSTRNEIAKYREEEEVRGLRLLVL